MYDELIKKKQQEIDSQQSTQMTSTQYQNHIRSLEGSQPPYKEYVKKNQKEIEKLTEL